MSYEEQNECNRLLADCKAFERMTPEVRAVIANLMTRKTFAPGEVLMRQGDEGDSLIVLSEGTASVVLEIPGEEDSLLRTVSHADVVGEMALITRLPRMATVRAKDTVAAFLLPAADYHDLANRHPQVSVVMTDLLSDRLGTDRVDAIDHKSMGGYKIEGCLARGAMGVVYEASHEETGDVVALKMMDHRLSYNSNALARFHREAALSESLDHPNLVRVHKKFEAFRTFFLVMEYCDGPTLSQLLEMAGPLPDSAVRKILGQLFEGLTYLHGLGITHRDVKLSNVLSNQNGIVKLGDFGLARPKFEPELTDAGILVGTPAYMAPEQFEGAELEQVVDFYALGCLAYELLNGRPLFDEPSLPAMMSRKMTFTMPQPQYICKDLSEELYDVLKVALSRKPADRVLPADLLQSWSAPFGSDLISNEKWSSFNIAHGSTATIVNGEIRDPRDSPDQ